MTHEPKQENTDFIREMELESLHLSTERNEYAEQALRIKTEVMAVVEDEWEILHTKGLSNQTKRNAAADGRLALNEEYQILISDIRELDATLKELAINISFEKRQFTRETAHISDINNIRESISLMARDIHGVAMQMLG